MKIIKKSLYISPLLTLGTVCADVQPDAVNAGDTHNQNHDLSSVTGASANSTHKIIDLPYQTTEVEDSDLPSGERKVVIPGVVGKKEIIKESGGVTQDPSSTAIKDGATYKQSLTTNNKLAVTNEVKPLDLFLIIDGSGSTTGRVNSSSNASQIEDVILQDAEKLVQSLPDGSQVMITSYLENKASSYRTNRYTKLMSKADALRVIKDFQTLPQARDWYTMFESYAKAHPDKFLPAETKEYEDAYSSQSNKNDLVSVVQFTDAWDKDLNETIDTSFAEWAKANAKTFMSVLYPNADTMVGKTDKNDIQSYKEMVRIGHPNIYNTWEIPDATRQQEIISKFQNTAVEKKVNSAGHITFGLNGATISNVELIKPDGTKVTGQQNVEAITQFDQEGNYTLNYEITPNPKANSSVATQMTVSGNGNSKTDSFIYTEGVDTERVILEPVNEVVHIGTAGTTTESRREKIPFATEIIEDESLPEGVDKVTVEGVEGEREYVTTYKTVKGQKVGEPISVTNYLTNHVVTKIVHHGVRGSKTEVEDVAVPYQTRYVEDDALPLGTRKVVQSGENGIRKITRTWITQRQLKVGDPVDVKEAISKEARDEIIHIGTREYVRDENYVSIPNTPVNSDTKSVIGQKGQKLMIDWYAIAKGKRVSDVKSNEHLLRMPINEVAGTKTETKVGVGNGFSIRKFSLPPKKIANPAKLVNPYESDITSQALSILRRYKF